MIHVTSFGKKPPNNTIQRLGFMHSNQCQRNGPPLIVSAKLLEMTGGVLQTLAFLVQGSAPEPYQVDFALGDSGNITATCTCPAGAMGQYCKHRFNILAGDLTGIASGNEPDVALVSSWLPGSDVERALTALGDAEREFRVAKSRVAAAKKAIAKAMSD